jgi:biopolymer transport protein ExbB
MTSYMEIIMKGGIVMIPIFICSVIATSIIIGRLWTLRNARINSAQFMMRLRSLIMKGRNDDAVDLCANTDGSLAKILRKGIARIGRPKAEVQETIQNAGKEEIYHLEKNLGILASVAGVAPLIGFLGTVIGMIQAFMQIEVAGGSPNPADLAGGIWVALITTAAGLSVGIPTQIFYNFLISKVEKMVFEMESHSTEILDLMFNRSDDEE